MPSKLLTNYLISNADGKIFRKDCFLVFGGDALSTSNLLFHKQCLWQDTYRKDCFLVFGGDVTLTSN